MGVFYEAERQNRQVSVVVDLPEASGGRIVLGPPGGAARISHVRALPAAPGRRVRARFRVRGHGLRLDVATDWGRRILAERTVDPGPVWVDVALPFVVEHARPLEFRVAWDGQREAAIDWVLVVARDRPDPEWAYEAEALPHRLGDRSDPAASGGSAVYADPGESQPERGLLGGPVRLFPAGRYRLPCGSAPTAPGAAPLSACSHRTWRAVADRAGGGSVRGAPGRIPRGGARLRAPPANRPRVHGRVPRRRRRVPRPGHGRSPIGRSGPGAAG